MSANEQLRLLAGNANPVLAAAIADRLGSPLIEATVTTFSDGEIRVRIHENVRGADIFIIQPTSAPVNQNLMELLILIDALKRSSVSRITAVIPYFGYARQEKKTAGREPISAKLVANLITVAGTDRIVALDLSAAAVEGFFDIPVDHLRATPILAHAMREMLPPQDTVIVAPDEGAVDRASRFQARYGQGASFAIVLKHRTGPDMAEVRGMIGDVAGCRAILVDDIISTGTTLILAAEELLERGATEVYAAVTHPVLSPAAAERLQASPLAGVVVTNSIAVPPEKRFPKLTVLSVADLLAATIDRIHTNRSVSELIE
ncbi:MAG: ribose-phosphate pyrophosphokinase [Anaerolineae bacterium]